MCAAQTIINFSNRLLSAIENERVNRHKEIGIDIEPSRWFSVARHRGMQKREVPSERVALSREL